MENMAEFRKEHEKKMLIILLSSFFEFIMGADNSMTALKKLSKLKGEERIGTFGGFCEGFIEEHYDEFKEFEQKVLAQDLDAVSVDLMEFLNDMEKVRVSGLSMKSRGDC